MSLPLRTRAATRRGVLGGEGDGLLDEDVLARRQGALRPFDVKMVGQRDVDGLDSGVAEQFLVGAVGSRNPELVGHRAGPCGIAGRDRVDSRARALIHGSDYPLDADPRRAEHAP